MAERLEDWLRRHPEMEARLTKAGKVEYTTTDDPDWFSNMGIRFLSRRVEARRVCLTGEEKGH